MTDTPERELIEALRSPTQWSCIFEYDGQPRYGTTDAPIRAADTIEALLSRVDKLEERVGDALEVLHDSSKPTPDRVRDAKLALNRTAR